MTDVPSSRIYLYRPRPSNDTEISVPSFFCPCHVVFARLVKNVRFAIKRSNCFGIPKLAQVHCPNHPMCHHSSCPATLSTSRAGYSQVRDSVFESGVEISFIFGKASGDASPCNKITSNKPAHHSAHFPHKILVGPTCKTWAGNKDKILANDLTVTSTAFKKHYYLLYRWSIKT